MIAPQLRSVNAERADLRDAVLSSWANHYPLTPADNVLGFNCGVILLELRFFAEALLLFQASERQLGRSAATSYNLGLCALGLGRLDQALAFMVDAEPGPCVRAGAAVAGHAGAEERGRCAIAAIRQS